MSESYDAKLCEEKHKRIDEKFNLQEKRINNHSERIDRLEQDSREYKTHIKNLCSQMESLISTIKWGLGIFVTVSVFVIGVFIKK
ncbi:hemolysin XhlA family protein [Clostridium sp. 19966]|uniref:hemolysin XhlA family protein n=1 Tax=Clostridium sp. 19966 TaxID=2768166 RepID=UPI0028DF6F05|nr:hemolysin XhlA family protein [Clostridium sp. 19966]MDT8715430.1 hemolysin XhlA family protein [Clostridium sp. 19966]